MNVVFLTNKLVNGGGERVLVRLIEGVCAAGGTATILFLGKRAAISMDIQREMESAGARVVLPTNPLAAWKALRSATSLHLYNINVYVKALALWPLMVRRRVICHVHGAAESANPLARMLFCAGWNPCDYLVFVSEAGKASYGVARGIVVPNPVFFPPVRSGGEISAGRGLRLLSVNRLVKVKRVAAQIEIVAALRDRHGLNVTLDIVGEGAEHELLVAKVEALGLGEAVHFLGGREHKDVLELYQSYDVFFATSAAEGLGLSLIEALAAGLPAFAASIPPYREVSAIGGGVQFIDPDTPAAAADEIAEALIAGTLAPADSSALQQSFDPDAFLARMTELYR
tara:strand:+ start:9256 stop:10281 length:1026 start_codon:yes stop_codon:yes gene_type:complete